MKREEAPMHEAEQIRQQGEYREDQQRSQSRHSLRKLQQKVRAMKHSGQREISQNYLSQLRQWENRLNFIANQNVLRQRQLTAQTKGLCKSYKQRNQADKAYWMKEIQQTEAGIAKISKEIKEKYKMIDKLKHYYEEDIQNFKQWKNEEQHERDLREQNIEVQKKKIQKLKIQVNSMRSLHQQSVSQACQSQIRQKQKYLVCLRKSQAYKQEQLALYNQYLSVQKEEYMMNKIQLTKEAIKESQEEDRKVIKELQKLRNIYDAHKQKYKLRSKECP